MTRNFPRSSPGLRLATGLLAIAMLASVMAASGSCGGATVTGPASPDSVHLTYGVRTLVKDVPVAFTFEKIVSDSRCPDDVVCVWAGELRVQVRAENIAAAGPQPMTQLLEFSTFNQRVQEAFGYRMELINARPRGGGDRPSDASYWIALRVTPLGQ